MKFGLIGFSTHKTNKFSALIRFFTKSKISHSFISLPWVTGESTIQEASMLVRIVPFNKFYKKDPNQSYMLFDVKASDERKYGSLSYCYKEFAGVEYGYLQLLWFIYRWFFSLFGKDVRKEKNWMSNGVICSELVYYYLYNLGEPFINMLKDYNPDTIQAEDLLCIAKENPEYFTLIESKE